MLIPVGDDTPGRSPNFNDFFFEDKNICNLSYSISWFMIVLFFLG